MVIGKVQGKTYVEYIKRMEEIDRFLSLIKLKATDGNSVPVEILEKGLELKAEWKKCERITRCWTSTLEFMYEYFSEDSNPQNENNLIPEGISIFDAPHFHLELAGYLDSFLKNVVGRIAWSVPRGHAKSTR
jgi:hypothetical protein